MSSLGAPLAPIRSVSKHKRPQSQPRPASRAVAIDDQQMLALGYHETQQGAPPVPLIPARSPLRSRANSASATLGVEMMVVTAPPPVPPMPATLKKKHIRTLKTTAARPVQAAPSGSSMPLTAPPRPPRPDDIDCLLDSSPPADYPPPMPPIPVDLLANVPRARQTRGHGHSNSFGSSSNTSGSGSASISTPRVSQDSLEFRHVPLSSHSSTSTHARSNSQKSISSNPHPGEMPSMSVFEESSDEDELAYALDRGSSRKFRKGGLSLITRSSNKQPSSKDTTFNAPPRITPGKKTPTASGHHAPNPKLGPSHGSETLSSTSTGERTLPDDPSNKRFGRALSGRNGPPKMDHPDDELIALMQGLKKPKRRENSTRTRPSHERDVTESKSLSMECPSPTVPKIPSFAPITLGGIMIQ